LGGVDGAVVVISVGVDTQKNHATELHTVGCRVEKDNKHKRIDDES
jgi:hypothetical protein